MLKMKVIFHDSKKLIFYTNIILAQAFFRLSIKVLLTNKKMGTDMAHGTYFKYSLILHINRNQRIIFLKSFDENCNILHIFLDCFKQKETFKDQGSVVIQLVSSMNYGFQVYLITIKLVQEEELSTC
jgi:hypothetical protein